MPARLHKSGDTRTRWNTVGDAQALQQAACRFVLNAAKRAIQRHGRFLIVLAGGSTPLGLYRMLRNAGTAWTCWQVYFGDERCLPRHDAARNSVMAANAWLNYGTSACSFIWKTCWVAPLI